MSPPGCWGLPMALLALLFCPGSAVAFEVRMWPEQLAMKPGESQVVNCSTTCPQPEAGGLETTLRKNLLDEQAQWKLYKIFNFSQDTVILCHFICSGRQKSTQVKVNMFYPPEQVELTLQPSWVTVGNPFTIECRVPAVAPLDNFTLTLLYGKEPLHRQTFDRAVAAPEEVMVTHNRTARREDGHHNFSCQAELDLRSRGGNIFRVISEPKKLKIYEPRLDDPMVIIIAVVSVLLFLFVTSVLLCFIFGQQWHQRRRGSYGVQAAWRRLRRAYWT